MYRFFAFDQSGLTTAVWQYIFHFLLRIGNKDDVIDDIKKQYKTRWCNVLRFRISYNNCFDNFDCLTFFQIQLNYISMRHDAAKTIKFVEIIANV